jgi:hypothetical protein
MVAMVADEFSFLSCIVLKKSKQDYRIVGISISFTSCVTVTLPWHGFQGLVCEN